MDLGDEDVAVRRDEDVIRLIEVIGIGPAARLAKRQQQLAVLVELEHLMSLGRTSCGAHRSCRPAASSGGASGTTGCSASWCSGSAAGTTCCAASTARRCATPGTGGTAALARTVVVAVRDPDVAVAIDEQT